MPKKVPIASLYYGYAAVDVQSYYGVATLMYGVHFLHGRSNATVKWRVWYGGIRHTFFTAKLRLANVYKAVVTGSQKRRMLVLSSEGMRAPTIAHVLRAEGVRRRGIAKFLLRYEETNTLARKPGSCRKSILTEEQLVPGQRAQPLGAWPIGSKHSSGAASDTDRGRNIATVRYG